MRQASLSARARHRILKLARMLADLAGNEIIQQTHLAETLHAAQLLKGHAALIDERWGTQKESTSSPFPYFAGKWAVTLCHVPLKPAWPRTVRFAG